RSAMACSSPGLAHSGGPARTRSISLIRTPARLRGRRACLHTPSRTPDPRAARPLRRHGPPAGGADGAAPTAKGAVHEPEGALENNSTGRKTAHPELVEGRPCLDKL